MRRLAIIAAPARAQTPVAPEPPKFARVSGVVIDEREGRLRRVMVCLHRGADREISKQRGLQRDRRAAWRTPSRFPEAWDEVSTKGTPVEVPEGGRISIALTVFK